ncbi:MAG: amino acid synthesis family protein [Alphaproteobacteria bacterium]|nr:amino acid synthesis family protein [Alphaproteobacteria bacterium]
MLTVRKLLHVAETTFSEAGQGPARPVRRVAGIAVIDNPCAGRFVQDLAELFDFGRTLGDRLMPELARLLGAPAVSYGKAAIVGVNGDFEHGGALVHPKLGKPMRAAVGGGKAVIPSNVKLAPAGTPVDLPLGHKDEPWSFDHFDTWTLAVADAPRPNELVVIMAIADGGRLNPRCGTTPITA